MSAASFNALNTVLKSRTLEQEPLKHALDAHLGTGKLKPGDLSNLAFELGTRRHAKGGTLIQDDAELLAGIEAKSRVLADALRARM